MNKKMLAGLALALVSLTTAAVADTLSMDGKVDAKDTIEVYAPIGGTVERVIAEVGQEVQSGEILATLRTKKVYADEDGVVTGIFAVPGDLADTVASRYGAVLYIEGSAAFKIDATTDNAYNSASAKFVHVGETVFVRCKSNASRNGVGRITSIDGTAFTVEIDEGSFIPGDAVELYREKNHGSGSHIGSGTAARKNPLVVSTTGSVVSIAVQDGDTVKKGDLLLETLEGSFDGLVMTGAEIRADRDGVISQLNLTQGAAVAKDSVAAVLYARESMRVSAEVPEDSLDEIKTGDTVHIELSSDETKTYEGVVTMISGVATASQGGEVTYRALIDFTPDDAVRYGMSVIVETRETEKPAVVSADEEAEEEIEGEAAEMPERKGGRPEHGLPPKN